MIARYKFFVLGVSELIAYSHNLELRLGDIKDYARHQHDLTDWLAACVILNYAQNIELKYWVSQN